MRERTLVPLGCSVRYAGYPDQVIGSEGSVPLTDSIDRSVGSDQCQNNRPSLWLVYLIELVPEETLLGVGTADQDHGRNKQADYE